MKIAIICEGETERAFLEHLRAFLQTRLAGRMPKLDPVPYDGRIPRADRLRRVVDRLLSGKQAADAVIALTDVHTGTNPPDFADATDAKAKLEGWVGPNPKFYAHAAQHDFEAWLLPHWREIQKLAAHNRAAPSGQPESVNHLNPPAARIKEVFRTGNRGRAYVKPRDAGRILRGQDLTVAALACPELKAFLNTILTLCGGSLI